MYSIAPFIPTRLGEIAAPGRVGHLGTSSTTLPRRAFMPDVWPGRALQDGGSRNGRRHRSLRMQPPDCAVRRASPLPFLAAIALFLAPRIGGRGLRGAKLHVAPLGRDGAMLNSPGSRAISAGIAALAIGFALGLQAVPPGVSVSETIRPKNFDTWASLGSEIPDSRRLRVASLESEAAFEPATEGRDRQSELATSTSGRARLLRGKTRLLSGRPESER